MTFDPKREAGHYIDVSAAPMPVNPTLRHPRQRDISPSVDVATLKTQWSESTQESFKEWCRNVPDPVFLHWTQKVREQQIRESWETAVQTVLALRGGKATYSGKILMAELESSAAFQNLSTIDQKSARWIIENQDKEFTAKS